MPFNDKPIAYYKDWVTAQAESPLPANAVMTQRHDYINTPDDYDKYAYADVRVLSAYNLQPMNPRSFDFGDNGGTVLKESVSILPGVPVKVDHSSQAENFRGKVIAAWWEPEMVQDGVVIPAGIKARIAVYKWSAAAEGLKEGTIRTLSASLKVESVPSHPKLVNKVYKNGFTEFHLQLGKVVDGQVVRNIPTKIRQYVELSLVHLGFDETARTYNKDGSLDMSNVAKYVGEDLEIIFDEASCTFTSSVLYSDNSAMENTELTELSEKLNTANKQLEELQEQLSTFTEMKDKVSTLEAGMKTAEAKASTLEQELSNFRGEHSKLEASYNEVKTQLTGKETELATFSEKLTKVEAEKQALATELDNLRKQEITMYAEALVHVERTEAGLVARPFTDEHAKTLLTMYSDMSLDNLKKLAEARGTKLQAIFKTTAKPEEDTKPAANRAVNQVNN